MRRNLAGLFVGLLGAALLLWATAGACRAVDLAELDAFRRLWSDMAVGIDAYLDARAPLAPDVEPTYAGPDGLDADRTYRRLVVSGARDQDIRPWQFWRTLPERPFRRLRLEPVPKHYDDHGRGHLLGLGFRLLGGVAPFLIVWLGAFCCVPVVFWAAWDLVRAGLPAAAAAFVSLLGVSCFWVESLALTRYAVGFYLVALLLIVPLAAYAVSPAPTQRGLLVRAVLGGALFALAASCRSSVGLLLPGILLALALGVSRLAGSRLRRGALLLALSLPFVLPFPVMRRAQQSDVWQPLWEGLGDFDRSKGYAWSDATALQAVRAASGRKLWTPRSERIFKERILQDVAEDPGWYAAILAKRLASVVLQTKLWPWTPRDGRSMAPALSPNEGVMDKYYSYTATLDHFGLGAARVELPVALLLLPLPLLLARAAAPPGPAWSRPGRARARDALKMLACAGLAALLLPVLITTAGGQETQAFGLVYLLGAALLVEVVRADAAGWRRARFAPSVLALLTFSPGLGAAPKPPNIVLVVVDDLRFDDFAAAGHPFARTPHIDRLAREGVRFLNAFATTPLCSPSRASILTGLYAHHHGILDNTNRSEASHRLPSFPRQLRQAGYETAFIGKWHMGNDDTPRPGFDHWVAMKGQGEAIDPWLFENGARSRVSGYVTDLLSERALEFVSRRRAAPFFLMLAHKALHPNFIQHDDGSTSAIGDGGFVPAERHRALYEDAAIPRRPNYARRPKGKPALERRIGDLPPLGPATVTDDKTIRDRLRMLAAVDEGLGALMARLQERADLDQTLIVLVGDNGYFYGEHGLRDERRLAYEESIRAPLLVRYPPVAAAGATPPQLALGIDIAPTLLELAGVRPALPMDGRSLVPLLRGHRAPWRDSFLIEYTSDIVFPRIERMGYRALRSERHKYIRYRELQGMDELYDLEADPYELENLIASAAHQALRERLDAQLEDLVAAAP